MKSSLEGGNPSLVLGCGDVGIASGPRWAEKTPEGRAWLARLPQLIEECAAAWELELGPPFPYAYASLAAPARLPTGAEAVLKICFPHRESEREGMRCG